jgi:aerobic carbon-monoxide dehydrogenase medium subunit
MKPAPFDYYAPASLSEALERLAELGYGGKVLAGGQSLIPAMNFRMAQPAALVDLNRIPELFFLRPESDGGMLIGTMTRDSLVENDPRVQKQYPIIAETMVHIAHPQIRNRGTFGGALAHADPAGQLPCVFVALNGRFHIRSKTNDQWISADDFFMGPFTTVLQPEEMLVEAALPPVPPHSGMCYQQVARQAGSQVQVGVASFLTLDDKKQCKAVNIVLLGVGERPILARQASQVLLGKSITQEAIAEAANLAAQHEIDPGTDIHATAEYRRHIADVLVRRTLTEALKRAMA